MDTWNSEAARGIIYSLNLCENPAVEPWVPLASDTESAIAENDSVRLHRNCAAMLDMIKLSRRELEEEFGRDFWKQAYNAVRPDPRARICLRVFQQTAMMNRRDATLILVDATQRGVPYRLSTGRQRRWGGADCAFADIVELTRVLSQLLHLASVPVTSSDRIHAAPRLPLVMRINLNGRRLDLGLWTGERLLKQTSVTGQSARLLLVLSSIDYRRMVDEGCGKIDDYLYDHVWPNKSYLPPREGGPPPKLRTAAKVVRKVLQEEFGTFAPEGEWVVRREDPRAYALTPRIKWKVNDGEINSRATTFYSQEIDRRRVSANHVRTTKESHDQECERSLANRPKPEPLHHYHGPHAD